MLAAKKTILCNGQLFGISIERINTQTDEQTVLSAAEFLFDGFGKFYPNQTLGTYEQSVRQKSANNKIPWFVVALLDKKPVGIAGTYLKWGDSSTQHLTPWFGSLYVKPEYRKNGIAKYLYEYVATICKEEGYQKIYLHTSVQEDLYKRWGWQTIGAIGQEKIMEMKLE